MEQKKSQRQRQTISNNNVISTLTNNNIKSNNGKISFSSIQKTEDKITEKIKNIDINEIFIKDDLTVIKKKPPETPSKKTPSKK